MKTNLLLLTLAATALGAPAQTFSLDWWTVDGGGGTSAGGVYSVSGAVGQPDAGVMSGGEFTLVGGFWSEVNATQPAQVPQLSVEPTALNCVRIFWPASAVGFVLQEKPRLDSTPWTEVTASIIESNGCKQFLIAPATGTHFYRLKFRP